MESLVVAAFSCVLGAIGIMGTVLLKLTKLLLSREQVMLDRIKAVNQQAALVNAPRIPAPSPRRAGEGNLHMQPEE